MLENIAANYQVIFVAETLLNRVEAGNAVQASYARDIVHMIPGGQQTIDQLALVATKIQNTLNPLHIDKTSQNRSQLASSLCDNGWIGSNSPVELLRIPRLKAKSRLLIIILAISLVQAVFLMRLKPAVEESEPTICALQQHHAKGLAAPNSVRKKWRD